MYWSVIELIDSLIYTLFTDLVMILLKNLFYIYYKVLSWILSSSTDTTPIPCDHQSASF